MSKKNRTKKKTRSKKQAKKFISLRKVLFNGKSLVVVIMLGLIAWAIVEVPGLKLFKVKEVKANFGLCYDCQQLVLGDSIFTTDLKQLYDCLEKRYPRLKNIRILRAFPATIKVIANERTPFAQLKQDGYYFLDDNGVILSDAKTKPYNGLVAIELGGYHKSLKIGDKIKDRRLDLAFRLLSEINETELSKKFKISNINAYSSRSLSFFIDDLRVSVGQDKIGRKIQLLIKLLNNKFNYDISRLRYIDLRYIDREDNVYIGKKW
jgi:cell division septal protein FtsQ